MLATSATKASGNSVTTKKEVRIGSGTGAYHFKLESRVYVADAERLVSSALVTKVEEARDAMDYHRFLRHTNESQTRPTAKKLGAMRWIFDGESLPHRSAKVNRRNLKGEGWTALH